MKEYSNKPRNQRLKEIIVGQGLVALLIVVVSLYLIFWGLGYQINWKTLKIIHTGMVYLSYTPRDSNVAIFGQNTTQKSPFDARLLPGTYSASISKDGYVTWQQNLKVVADQVTSFKNVTLFKQTPEVQIVSDVNTISSIDSPYDTLVKNPEGNLAYNDHEIWIGNSLVTRLSSTISGVIWYPGSEYLAYQTGDEIRIIERNGTNDVLLVKLSSSAKTNFLFSWDGSSLLYKDGLIYKKATII